MIGQTRRGRAGAPLEMLLEIVGRLELLVAVAADQLGVEVHRLYVGDESVFVRLLHHLTTHLATGVYKVP